MAKKNNKLIAWHKAMVSSSQGKRMRRWGHSVTYIPKFDIAVVFGGFGENSKGTGTSRLNDILIIRRSSSNIQGMSLMSIYVLLKTNMN